MFFSRTPNQHQGYRYPTLNISLLKSEVKKFGVPLAHTSNVLSLHLSGSGWRQSKSNTIFWFTMRSDLLLSAQRGVNDYSSHKSAISGNKARWSQRCISDSHYKNSVYWFNKFTSLFLWLTSVYTIHGRHPRWSSFSVFVYNSVKRHTKRQLSNQNWTLQWEINTYFTILLWVPEPLQTSTYTNSFKMTLTQKRVSLDRYND